MKEKTHKWNGNGSIKPIKSFKTEQKHENETENKNLMTLVRKPMKMDGNEQEWMINGEKYGKWQRWKDKHQRQKSMKNDKSN